MKAGRRMRLWMGREHALVDGHLGNDLLDSVLAGPSRWPFERSEPFEFALGDAVGVADLDRLDTAQLAQQSHATGVDVQNGGRFRGRQVSHRSPPDRIGFVLEFSAIVYQGAGVAVRERDRLARQFFGQAAEVEPAVGFSEAEWVAVADDQQA